MEDLNDTIKNLKEMIEKRDFIIKDQSNRLEDLRGEIANAEQLIKDLEQRQCEEKVVFRNTIALRGAERDSFKEALRIVTRKVRNNG